MFTGKEFQNMFNPQHVVFRDHVSVSALFGSAIRLVVTYATLFAVAAIVTAGLRFGWNCPWLNPVTWF